MEWRQSEECGQRLHMIIRTLCMLHTHRVIECHGVDDHELAEVVLVRIVVTVPCHHIKRRMILQFW